MTSDDEKQLRAYAVEFEKFRELVMSCVAGQAIDDVEGRIDGDHCIAAIIDANHALLAAKPAAAIPAGAKCQTCNGLGELPPLSDDPNDTREPPPCPDCAEGSK